MRARACCRMAAAAGAAYCGACGASTSAGRRRGRLVHADCLAAAALFVSVVAGSAGMSATSEGKAEAAPSPTSGADHGWGGWVDSVFGGARAEGALITDTEPALASTEGGPAEPSPSSEREAEETPAATDPVADVEVPATAAPPAPAPSRLLTPAYATASTYSGSTGGGTSYHPSNAIDGDRSTGWQVSRGGVGEWIRIDLGAEMTVDRVGVLPGYDKWVPDRYGDRWPLNNRVAEVRIGWDGGSRAASYADLRDVQFTDLGGVRTRAVTIHVLGVHPGSRWDDTVISEIQIMGR